MNDENKWEVEYPCGCSASGYSRDPLPNYCPQHGEPDKPSLTKIEEKI